MKRILVSVLALMLLLSGTVLATGVQEPGETGSTPAVLTQEGTSFSVTIPTKLPIQVDSDGKVTVATSLIITNNSFGPVEVKNIEVNPKRDWSLANFNKDFSQAKVGLKEFGLKLNNEEVNTGGKVNLFSFNWPAIDGNGDSLPVDYNANVAAQKSSTLEEIADIIFTIGWFEEEAGVSYGPNGEFIPAGYVLASDDDFSEEDDVFYYIGSDDYVVVPHKIKGVPVTSYSGMFQNTSVKGVASNNSNVTDMNGMFQDSQATSLDLSSLNTSNVTNMKNLFRSSQATFLDLSSLDTSKVTIMYCMFQDSQATSLDLSSLDTSKVTIMYCMFQDSQATSLNLSNFDTSNVTNMHGMFNNSQATSLDLSSFDTSNVTNMDSMFQSSQATIGYARTQTDADRFNASSNKPFGLTFVVK